MIELAVEVKDLLQELADEGLAQNFTLTKLTSGAYDPALGIAPVTKTNQTVLGSIFDLDLSQTNLRNTQDGLAKFGDKRALLSVIDTNGADVTVEPDYMLTDKNGKEYTVIDSGLVDPGGESIVHDLILRG